MRIAIHQPNYIPWCGYFAKMMSCDVFVFLDDAEVSPGQSYVYRSMIVDQSGEPKWLSVPTHRYPDQLIKDVTFADRIWSTKHFKRIFYSYNKSSYYTEVSTLLEPFFIEPGEFLSIFNIKCITAIAKYLNIESRLEVASVYMPEGRGDDRLISLARIFGADTYVSGKGGQNYQDPEKFNNAGIKLETHEYQAIPYEHFRKKFFPGISILDALFNLGRGTIKLLEYPLISPNS
jgi:hypothetical protein